MLPSLFACTEHNKETSLPATHFEFEGILLVCTLTIRAENVNYILSIKYKVCYSLGAKIVIEADSV